MILDVGSVPGGVGIDPVTIHVLKCRIGRVEKLLFSRIEIGSRVLKLGHDVGIALDCPDCAVDNFI
ncbi:MAG: hypothetical protein BWY82_01190 [Verrucomicrobia bacterium ADurb.Bin474]|nr:MAG: hypothetical protein BWY82_01190 [Verrucomicrobia bacterium ADurb.Bin474]